MDELKFRREPVKGSETAKREKKVVESANIVLLWLKSGGEKECGDTLKEKIAELRAALCTQPITGKTTTRQTAEVVILDPHRLPIDASS